MDRTLIMTRSIIMWMEMEIAQLWHEWEQHVLEARSTSWSCFVLWKIQWWTAANENMFTIMSHYSTYSISNGRFPCLRAEKHWPKSENSLSALQDPNFVPLMALRLMILCIWHSKNGLKVVSGLQASGSCKLFSYSISHIITNITQRWGMVWNNTTRLSMCKEQGASLQNYSLQNKLSVKSFFICWNFICAHQSSDKTLTQRQVLFSLFSRIFFFPNTFALDCIMMQ